MPMLQDPSNKYRRFPKIHMPDRRWPDAEIATPPLWCSVDLRDGNQALIEPMDGARKRRMFDELVRIGFKEIEVGFPSASQTDFDFVTDLIRTQAIPDDVTIQVLTQAREELITRTFEAVRGARRVIFHLYHATAPVMRERVFGLTEDEVVEQLALRHVRLIRELTDKAPDTEWVFQYSPEMFSTTELPFSRRIVDAVVDTWGATSENPCIINLPSTVEASTPSTFADMVEWMHRNVAKREAMVLSVHPHNDRGTGTAAAELAVMAGADRLEGCLFGNGERTGNLDLVNVALNLYSQGIHPGLDVSDIDRIRNTVEHCNQLPVHPRHPYVGDLVYTSFSGSHQDAIKKVLGQRRKDETWDVPYLPIDPADLGRSYQAVIRVNSQSGKGGITYLLEHEYGVALPRRAQIEFSQAVQRVMDDTGKELSASDIWDVFNAEYLTPDTAIELVAQTINEPATANGPTVECDFNIAGHKTRSSGQGPNLVAAVIAALNAVTKTDFTLVSAQTQSLQAANENHYGCYVELRREDGSTRFGVGIAADEKQAQAAAVISACNRLYQPAKASAAA